MLHWDMALLGAERSRSPLVSRPELWMAVQVVKGWACGPKVLGAAHVHTRRAQVWNGSHVSCIGKSGRHICMCNNATGFACGWRMWLQQGSHRTPSKCCQNLGPWDKVSVSQCGALARERDRDGTVGFYRWKGPGRWVNSNLLPAEDPRPPQWQSDAERTWLLMQFFIPTGHSQLLTGHFVPLPSWKEWQAQGQTFTGRHLDRSPWRAGVLLIAGAAISVLPRVPIWP